MTPKQIAKLLETTATYLRLTGANDFKVAAYDRGARTIEQMDAATLQNHLDDETLTDIKGIGKSLAAAIYEAHQNGGTFSRLESLKEDVPDDLLAWLQISSLGPKNAYKIHRALDIVTLDELRAACEDGRVAELKGLGQKSADKIIASMDWMAEHAARCRIDIAQRIAATFQAALAELPGVIQLSLAGSLRRRKETIGDIDFLIAADAANAPAILQAFVDHPAVTDVLGHGDTKSSVRTAEGRQVDLRVVAPDQFAAALMYFTGSKEHNVAMRGRARERGLALNEYGLFKLDADGNTDFDAPVPDKHTKTEAAIYQKLELPYVPPECREDAGEFGCDTFDLLEASDIKGILHAHTNYSDGATTLDDLARACAERGYTYLGITDHSQTAIYANGLRPADVEKQWAEIDDLNQRYKDEGLDLHIFKGIESDILLDGALDYPDDMLADFDFIIASIHSVLDMPADRMLARMQAAAANPFTTMIGHPTNRLLLKRDPSAIDLPALIETCAQHNTAIEINAHPHRLDIAWQQGPNMRAANLNSAICPDAHDIPHLDLVPYGVDVARKARLSPTNILNTKTTKQLAKFFKG